LDKDVEELTPAEIEKELASYETAPPPRRKPKPAPAAINELAGRIATCMFEKKAEDVMVLDLKGLTSVTDFFVVATATSELHVRAVADHIQSTLEEQGLRAHHVEGYAGLTWVLLDYIDVVVHVFQPTAREFYNLERLWGDAKITQLADPV
jgi:ribosome-associated protein